MEDWQQRVVEEKADLDGRLSKLTEFIHGEGIERYEALPDADQVLLLEQQIVMESYADILGERIARLSGVRG